MTPFETYTCFLALKRHFTTDDYDYFKYNKKIRASQDSFENRNDKYFFEKLSRLDDVENRILAACVYFDAKKLFIGNILRERKYIDAHKKLKATELTLNYILEQEFKTLLPQDLEVSYGQIPNVVSKYHADEIHLETLCVLNELSNVSDYWNEEVSDKLFFPDVLFKIRKYTPFLRGKFDKHKLKVILKESLS